MDEAQLHRLLDGTARGLWPVCARTALTLAEQLYALGVAARNWSFDHGWRESRQVSVPVISLGNLTTGGTGKTPLAAWLADWVRAHGARPGLLSRGYRALQSSAANSPAAAAVNDEKLVLDRLCPTLVHLQHPVRYQSAQTAIQQHGCDLLLLDDGFQHRQLHRDLDLVLLDALAPWGYGHLLPRGLLREPIANLRRADLVILTRADLVAEPQRRQLQRMAEQAAGTKLRWAEVAFRPQRLLGLDGSEQPLADVQAQQLVGFCGIGNPRGFAQTLARIQRQAALSSPTPPIGAIENNLAGWSTPAAAHSNDTPLRVYPDHHHYSPADLERLAHWSTAAGASAVVTTLKDMVKITAADWHGPPLYAIDQQVEWLSGADTFAELCAPFLPRVQRAAA